jgi:arsenite methyltransferase
MTHASPSHLPSESAARPISYELDSPELAQTYEDISLRQFNHGKILTDSLNIAPGEQVLDLGSGTGRLGAYVAERVGSHGRVLGIDPLPLRVVIANAKKIPNFTSAVGRAEDLSRFADETFDVVYLNSVFHWIADKPRALGEIFRVLKRGGRLGINSADAARPHQATLLLHEALAEIGIAADRLWAAGNPLPVDDPQLQALLEAAGFDSYRSEHHRFVDFHSDVDELFAFSGSSSFGNFLAELGGDERARVRDALARKLEAHRTPEGIRLERYLVFATARRAIPS